MKKSLSLKIFTVFYLLAALPLLGYCVYEIFRVKSINDPMDMIPFGVFLVLTLSYNVIVHKSKKSEAIETRSKR